MLPTFLGMYDNVISKRNAVKLGKIKIFFPQYFQDKHQVLSVTCKHIRSLLTYPNSSLSSFSLIFCTPAIRDYLPGSKSNTISLSSLLLHSLFIIKTSTLSLSHPPRYFLSSFQVSFPQVKNHLE